MSKVIVLQGSLEVGFEAIGPFDSQDDADNHNKSNEPTMDLRSPVTFIGLVNVTHLSDDERDVLQQDVEYMLLTEDGIDTTEEATGILLQRIGGQTNLRSYIDTLMVSNKARRKYRIADFEHATILAALRYYQSKGMGDPNNRSLAIHEIATNDDEVISLDADGIDSLCMRLNCGGE